jgi:gephyrin
MGTSDFMKTAMEKLQGLIHFGRVKVKPGKPTIFAQIPAEDGLLKPVFALPGNPASALTT